MNAVWSEEEEIEFAKEGKTFAMKTAYVYLSLFGLCVQVGSCLYFMDCRIVFIVVVGIISSYVGSFLLFILLAAR